MKAMCIDENRQFVWQEVPDPVCHGEFDVKLRVKACAVNRADLMQRAGIYAPPEGWPLWPGLECAGEVLEAPAGVNVKVGDRVCALLGGGGYAEEVVVPHGMCMPLPAGFDFWEATGIPEVYATAYLNLKLIGEIQPGETFFINGGEGGLGVATIQLAKHVFGAGKVIAQVASDANGEFCRQVGADITVNRFKDDLVETLKANPPDVAIDPVGGKLMGPCFATMNMLGRWISLASMAGNETVIDVNLLWRKNLRLIGSTLRRRTPEEKEQILAGLVREVWPALASRKFAPFVHKVLPIAEATEAHAILERGENRGKVVLTI